MKSLAPILALALVACWVPLCRSMKEVEFKFSEGPSFELTSRSKLKVTFQADQKTRSVRLYYQINDNTGPAFQTFLIKLRCKRKTKLCSGISKEKILKSDVIHYVLRVNLKGNKFAQFEDQWPPSSSSRCALMEGDLPSGYQDIVFEKGRDTATVHNPERGFYRALETKASNWEALTTTNFKGFQADGLSLLQRNFVLDSFVKDDINATILDLISADFNTVRDAGMKIIPRFYYTADNSNDDASSSQILRHIEQLKPILQDGADVIATLQAGFLGEMGEWKYSANNGGPPDDEGGLTEDDWIDREKIVAALLQALPPMRQVQVRKPAYKQYLAHSTTAITQEDLLKGKPANATRLAHYSTCILASAGDSGTYEDKAVEYPFLQQETKYLVMGGQTCAVNSPRSDCSTALQELSELHYSYLNIDHHPEVLQRWKDQGCFEQIVYILMTLVSDCLTTDLGIDFLLGGIVENLLIVAEQSGLKVRASLGYRLTGLRARLPRVVAVGTSFCVGVVMGNDGWAAPYNRRGAKIMMRHSSSEETYEIEVEIKDLDLRLWQPGSNYSLKAQLSVLPEAPTGIYKVYLVLPDPAPTLASRPEYNIILENLLREDDPWGRRSRANALGEVQVVAVHRGIAFRIDPPGLQRKSGYMRGQQQDLREHLDQ